MNAIVLLDTSIYLNVLDVRSQNQDKKQITSVFEVHAPHHDPLLLSTATLSPKKQFHKFCHNASHRLILWVNIFKLNNLFSE